MRVRTLLAALAMSALFAAHAVNIRVLVSSGPGVSVRVPINAAVTGLPAAGVPPVSYAEWQVGLQGSNLSLNGQDSGSPNLYLPPTPGSVVGIGGGEYRGGVLLRALAGKVEAINIVDLEDYLRGVVPAEMPSSWPAEALKAQAVIARTYAVSRLSPGAAYDLCASEQCQVYGGIARETPSANEAVAQTRGSVISFAGKAARAVFSSDSGGYTASAGEVWGTDYPYLVAQPDPLSRSPKSEWTLSIPLARVAEVAQRYNVRVGALQAVAITRLSASGRPLEVTFQGSHGLARIAGAEAGGFVRALGAHSTRVTFTGTDPLQVSGAGFGHGVGLSQWGASGLASRQWNYAQILGFYYPGVGLSQLQEARVLPNGGSVIAFSRTQTLVNLRESLPALAWSGASTE
ncbi:SpoIID/LytB domain-containing protein [Deinococcus peraridilitoris]|nr:SpoIID/LytB domain-containing protein [Deinococcus peraridilitoris]